MGATLVQLVEQDLSLLLAERVSLGSGPDITEVAVANRHGYIAHAASLVAATGRGSGTEWASPLICGRLSALISGSSLGASMTLARYQDRQRDTVVAAGVRKVLDKVNASEEELIAILEVAGEVMRGERLPMQSTPVIHVTDTLDDVGVLYQFVIPVDAKRASELTDRVIELLISRELDRPGIAFSFLGQAPA